MTLPRAALAGVSLAAFCVFAVPSLNAGLITVGFGAGLSPLDPAMVVTGSGATAASIVSQIFGSGAIGSGGAQVSASLIYQSDTAAFQQAPVGAAGSVANYLGPITAAQVTIAGSTVSANIPLINSSPASGAFVTGIGATTGCFGVKAFVSSFCPATGTVNPTNAALVTNNVDNTITLPNGTTVTKSADSLLLYVGGTTGSMEFSPALNGGAAGPLYVKSVFAGFIGKPGEDLFPSSALPQSPAINGLSRLDNTLIQVLLDGPGLTSPILLQGSATSLNIAGPTSVPEPGTLFLLCAGLGVTGWKARRQG